jgi:hypothetical protein
MATGETGFDDVTRSPEPGTADPVTLGPGPLATPVAEAVHLTALAYADDPAVDVEEKLRMELTRRAVLLEDASVLALARAVRAGRSNDLVAEAVIGPSVLP